MVPLTYLSGDDAFMSLCRSGDLDWTRAGPVLLTGVLYGVLHWLHGSSALCVLPEGLEVSPAGDLSSYCDLHPVLVVRCSPAFGLCVAVKHSLSNGEG